MRVIEKKPFRRLRFAIGKHFQLTPGILCQPLPGAILVLHPGPRGVGHEKLSFVKGMILSMSLFVKKHVIRYVMYCHRLIDHTHILGI